MQCYLFQQHPPQKTNKQTTDKQRRGKKVRIKKYVDERRKQVNLSEKQKPISNNNYNKKNDNNNNNGNDNNDNNSNNNNNNNNNDNNNKCIEKCNSRFFAISPLHCELSKQVRSSGLSAVVCKSCTAHRALITCNMSCYMPCGTKGQLSY